jgi:thioredoxin 2
LNEPVHVVCPRCNTTNRVQRERLDDAARCGSCHEPLLPSHAFALDASGLERHVASNDLPLVVDFWAPWCGPCRVMAPHYEEAARRLQHKARFAKVNSDEEPVAGRFNIRGIPTLIAFKHGREVARQVGGLDLNGLLRWVSGI